MPGIHCRQCLEDEGKIPHFLTGHDISFRNVNKIGQNCTEIKNNFTTRNSMNIQFVQLQDLTLSISQTIPLNCFQVMCSHHSDPLFQRSQVTQQIVLLWPAENLKLVVSGLVQRATFEAKRLVVANIDYWSITIRQSQTFLVLLGPGWAH